MNKIRWKSQDQELQYNVLMNSFQNLIETVNVRGHGKIIKQGITTL